MVSARRLLALAGLGLVLATGGCGGSDEGPGAQQAPGPISGLNAALVDRVERLPGDRIAWSTDWRFCWQRNPGARGYELEALTGEGSASEPIRQAERCYRIEAAEGENPESQGLRNRRVLLALEQGQLAYRVRPVLAGGRVGAWSEAVAVGDERPAGQG